MLLAQPLQRHASASALELILLPTEQCQFRCFECYERFEQGRMKPETVEGIKNLIKARSDDLESLHLSWFGGEPLLANDIVLDTMDCANEVCSSKGVRLSSSMTTNGYLLSAEMLEALTCQQVRFYQIAFDGNKDCHDKTRVRRDGAGTFDRIWSNVVSAHKSELKFEALIRVHVSKENIASVESFLERASRELGQDRRFSVFIRPVSRLGGANDSKLPVLEGNGSSFATYDENTIQKLRSKASTLGLRVKAEGEETKVCYASKLNSFVIRSDGTVGKCTVALYDDRNNIGRLLRDGTVEINPEKAMWWARGLFSGNDDQLACPLSIRKEAEGLLRDGVENKKYKVALKN